MGFSLVTGWVEGGVVPSAITVIEPSSIPDLATMRVEQYRDLNELQFDQRELVVVFAVKPIHIADILPKYAKLVGARNCFISLIAGKTLGFFSQYLGPNAHIIRTMPNLPVSIRQGVTALIATGPIDEALRAYGSYLFEMVGAVVWLKSEEQMDAVTAISGSGPAYLFLLADCLLSAAQELGLELEIAELLVKDMLSGSAALLKQSESSPYQLCQAVASPFGTTEAALKLLTAGNVMQNLITKATKAAEIRSKELTK